LFFDYGTNVIGTIETTKFILKYLFSFKFGNVICFPFLCNIKSENKKQMSTYLGQIEKGNDKVMVYGTKEGFKLIFNSNGNIIQCDLFDSDHVARELEHLGYSESFINVILSML
jgi:hypothetical protein